MYKILKGLIYLALGVLLLTVAAAAILPRFIDWKTYRTEIETQATALTGHKVIIGGDLDLSLLPSPSLTAEDVTVAGAPGTAPLARIGRLKMEVALLPLLAGRAEATSVVLVKPRVTLADGNWKREKAPATRGSAGASSTGGGRDLSLSLQNVRVQDGTISIARKGEPPAAAHKIDMQLSAETLTGPFRGAGTLTAGGIPLRLEFSVDQPADDGAVPLMVTLLPSDGKGARLWVRGDLVRPGPQAQFAGKLRIEGKSSRAPAALLLGALGLRLPKNTLDGPMSGEATLTASATGFRAGGLVLDLAGTALKADIDVRFGDEGQRRPRAKIAAVVSRVDLDALIAAWAASEPPGGSGENTGAGNATGGGSQAGGYRGIEIGNEIDIDLKVSVEALVLNRSVIRGVAAESTLADGRMTLKRLTALLPGAANVEISGKFTEEAGFTRFDGQLSGEAGNLRGMLDWLEVDVAGIPADRLRRSSLQARLSLGSDAVQLTDMKGTVDLAAFTGAAGIDFAARPMVKIDVAMGPLDLDAYAPRAIPAAAGGGEAKPKPASQGEDTGAAPAIDWARFSGDADIAVIFKTTGLTFQERALGPMSIAFETGEAGGELKHFTLGKTSSPLLSAAGTRKQTGEAVTLEGTAKLGNTGEVLALLGADAESIEGLPKGPLTAALRVSRENRKAPWTLSLTAEHSEGVATLTGTGQLEEKDGRRKITADLAASEIDAGLLVALVAGPGKGAGKTLGETGSGSTEGSGAGAEKSANAGWSRDALDLTMLHAVDLALGLKASALKAGDLRVEAPRLKVALDRGLLTVTDLEGKLYGGAFKGALTIDARAIPKFQADLDMEGVDLTRIVGAVRYKEKEIVGLSAGRAGLELKLTGEGASVAAIMSSLSGSADLKAADGIVKGFDLALANRQISDRKGDFGILGLISVAMTRGSSKFQTLSAAMKIDKGQITITKGALDAEGGDGTLAGTVDLPGRKIDLAAGFRFDSIPEAPPLDMRVTGALDAPRTVIDVKALTAWIRANPASSN